MIINPSLIRHSIISISKRRMRSFLTILSVLIGIASITALISFGYGISYYVEEVSQKMGMDKILVAERGLVGGFSAIDSPGLDKSDLDVINRVNGVEEVAGMSVLSAEVESNKQKRYTILIGINYKENKEIAEELLTVDLVEGSTLKGDEKTKVLLGYNFMLPDKIFSKPLKVGDKIKVNGQDLDILGFYGEIGNPSDDANVYVTEPAAEEVFGAKGYYEVAARVSPGENATKIAEDITDALRRHKNQRRGAETFFAQTFEQVMATFTVVLNVIIAVVVLIALISVLVAGVNIMNTMYASILERTKEIGIFKAIGARNEEILYIFMIEAGILSLIGGIIGVLLGMGIAKAGGIAMASAGYAAFQPYFSANLIISILAFSFLVGIGSGILPAYNASKLKPVEALRYE